MAGLIGSEGTPFSITFKDPDETTLGLMVGELPYIQREPDKELLILINPRKSQLYMRLDVLLVLCFPSSGVKLSVDVPACYAESLSWLSVQLYRQ